MINRLAAEPFLQPRYGCRAFVSKTGRRYLPVPHFPAPHFIVLSFFIALPHLPAPHFMLPCASCGQSQGLLASFLAAQSGFGQSSQLHPLAFIPLDIEAPHLPAPHFISFAFRERAERPNSSIAVNSIVERCLNIGFPLSFVVLLYSIFVISHFGYLHTASYFGRGIIQERQGRFAFLAQRGGICLLQRDGLFFKHLEISLVG